MKISRCAVTAAGMLMVAVNLVAAQPPSREFPAAARSLNPLDTLRLWAEKPNVSSRRVILESVRADTLRVIPASGFIDDIKFAAIRGDDVTRIDLFVPSGLQRHPVRRGLTGMLVGAAAGAATFAIAANIFGGEDDPRGGKFFVTAGGAAIGLVAGAITGTIVGVRRDRRTAGSWRTIFVR